MMDLLVVCAGIKLYQFYQHGWTESGMRTNNLYLDAVLSEKIQSPRDTELMFAYFSNKPADLSRRSECNKTLNL